MAVEDEGGAAADELTDDQRQGVAEEQPEHERHFTEREREGVPPNLEVDDEDLGEVRHHGELQAAQRHGGVELAEARHRQREHGDGDRRQDRVQQPDSPRAAEASEGAAAPPLARLHDSAVRLIHWTRGLPLHPHVVGPSGAGPRGT